MLKSNIDVFLVTSFLCSLKFVVFHRIGVYEKNSMAQFFGDMTVPSKCNVPSL